MENERQKRIKNLVVERNIGKSPRTGDKYRVLSRQVNEIIRLLSENDEFSLLPVDGMKDSEIADVIQAIINRPEIRNLKTWLKTKGIKSGYSAFIVKDDSSENSEDDSSENSEDDSPPEYLEREKSIIENFKITPSDFDSCGSYAKNILFNAKENGYRHSLEELCSFTENIYKDICYPKNILKLIGSGLLRSNTTNLFMYICEGIAVWAPHFLIVENESLDTHSALTTVYNKLELVHSDLKAEIKENREAFIRRRRDTLNTTATFLSVFFVQYLRRKAVLEEEEKIYSLLENTDLTSADGKGMHNCDIKKSNIRQLIEIAKHKNNPCPKSQDPVFLNSVFAECYIRKETYKRKQAHTIIKHLFKKQDITYEELLFLDMKLLRGYYADCLENNANMEDYKLYMKIRTLIKKLFLMTYGTMNEPGILEKTYNVRTRILDIYRSLLVNS